MAAGAQKQSSKWWLIFLLILLLIVGVFVLLPSYNAGVNTSTQSTTQNQCPQAGQNFDAQQEAFTLAQTAEQYRRLNPFGGNYGPGSYIICFTDGTQQRVQSIPFKGFRDYTLPYPQQHTTHSEQKTYGWLQVQLSRLSIDLVQITAIYVVIFTQVIVCPDCKNDMVYWQRTLRQKAKTNKLYLSIWQIVPGKGFAPTVYPGGTGIPITIDDIEEVKIEFVE